MAKRYGLQLAKCPRRRCIHKQSRGVRQVGHQRVSFPQNEGRQGTSSTERCQDSCSEIASHEPETANKILYGIDFVQRWQRETARCPARGHEHTGYAATYTPWMRAEQKRAEKKFNSQCFPPVRCWSKVHNLE